MRKSLIIILLIVILGGLGYFAYTKGLVKLDSFKKGDVKQIVLENNSEIIEKKEEIKTDPEQIIHPLCFGSYFQIESLINLEVCNKQEQKHPSKNDDGRISASYSTFENELGNENENEYGYTSYRILSQKDNIMVVAFIDNSGGSSTTTAILIYEKQGNILKLKNTVHEGDSDILMWDSDGTTIKYSLDLSGEELIRLIYPNTSRDLELGFLEWHFPSYAKANYSYDIETQKEKLLSVVFTNNPEKSGFGGDAQQVENNSECFQKLYHSYIPKWKTEIELTEQEVLEFDVKYMEDCIDPILSDIFKPNPQGRWVVDGGSDWDRDLVNTVSEEDRRLWYGKLIEIKDNKLKVDFENLPGYKNTFKYKDCNILNLDSPETYIGIDGVLKYNTDCVNSPFSEFYIDKLGQLEIYWGDARFSSNKQR
jgi:hypothetical protein